MTDREFQQSRDTAGVPREPGWAGITEISQYFCHDLERQLPNHPGWSCFCIYIPNHCSEGFGNSGKLWQLSKNQSERGKKTQWK